MQKDRSSVWAGGVSNAGTLQVEASTIYDNKAVAGDGSVGSGNGGGIYNGWGGKAAVVPQVFLLNSTVSGNEAGALEGQTPPSEDQTGASRIVAGRADSGALENRTAPMRLGKGAAAACQDRDGDAVTIVLAGPGEGYATVTDGADAVDIVLNGTTSATDPDQNPEMDERGFTYSFRCGNTLFLGIDEYAVLHDKDNGFLPPPSTEVPSVFCNGWLSGQIAAFRTDPTLEHCFAFGHSPLYTVKMDTSMDATASTASGRDTFVQTVSGAAEIYFCGHEHFYDHTIIAGTTLPGGDGIDAMHQVLVGTGGAEIDGVTEADCDYSASYVRDPARQYYHNPEIPASGKPQGSLGYNLVTIEGPNVTFMWKAWAVNNPCSHLPCGLCASCTVDTTPEFENSWDYSVSRR